MAVEQSASTAVLDAAIEAYYEDIRRAVRVRGAEQSAATEIVHDLYVKLRSKPERLTGKKSLRAFLIRAAINLGIDRARRSSFEARLFQALDEAAYQIPARSGPMHSRIDMSRRLLILQKTVLSLPDQCRRVFIAYRIAGMDKAEIAQGLGIKSDTVDRHLRKAMLRCLEKMDEFEGNCS